MADSTPGLAHAGSADAEDGTDGTPLRAIAVLDRDGTPEVLEFDGVSIDDPEIPTAALADAQGCTLALLVPGRALKGFCSTDARSCRSSSSGTVAF